MKKSEQTKAYIIEKAAPIFNKKGYAGTSLRDMTGATRLTKGSIYGNFANKDEAALAAAPGLVIRLATVTPESRNAELILPVTTMAEENGTYVNRDRRIQRYQQAKAQPGMARPAWWLAGEVIAGPGPDAAAPATAAEAFALLGERWPIFGGLTHDDLGFTGRVLAEAPAAAGGAR